MTKLHYAGKLADAAAETLNWFSDPALEKALMEFRAAKDWMLLEGGSTRVQCLVCFNDDDLTEDQCTQCGNAFDGIEDFREFADYEPDQVWLCENCLHVQSIDCDKCENCFLPRPTEADPIPQHRQDVWQCKECDKFNSGADQGDCVHCGK